MPDQITSNGGRFVKGQSGNPRGRPRKSGTVGEAIIKAASATVTATENGRRSKVRKLDAAVTQLANKGASGDLRAGKMLLDMTARAEAEQQAARSADAALLPDDRAILDRFLEAYRQHLEGEHQ